MLDNSSVFQPFDEPLHKWLSERPQPQPGTPISPGTAMELAVAIAYEGCGGVKTNPLVGSVVVDKNHRYVAAGAHLIYGEAHSEVNAVEAAKKVDPELLENATFYVTLEPCAHEGKTGSCAKLLATLPIKEVVYGHLDPNPEVSGKGLEILAEARIATRQEDYLTNLSSHALKPFLWSMKEQKTFFALKKATDLNGVFGFKDSTRAEISGTESRIYGHWMRHFYDAILVGSRTVELDNPKLNCRLWSNSASLPTPVVLDLDGNLLSKIASLHLTQSKKPIWVLSASMQAEELPSEASYLFIENKSEEKLWSELGSKLYQKKIQSCLIEGGNKVWQSALRSKIANRLHHFIAPKMLLAPNSQFANPQTEQESFSAILKDIHWHQLGNDKVLEAEIEYDEFRLQSI